MKNAVRILLVLTIVLSVQQILILLERGISGISVITSIWLWLNVTLFLIFLIAVASEIIKIDKILRHNLYLSVLVTFCGLISIELILRYILRFNLAYNEANGDFYYESFHREDFERHYLYSKNSSTEYVTDEFSYYRKTNSLGIVEREVSIEKEKNEMRILCLGDSFTEGIGAIDEKDSYPRVLETLLSDKYKKKVTVINAGIAGSDPAFQFILLKEIFLKYKPDLVIVATNTVDLEEVMVRGGLERFKDKNLLRNKSSPKWEPLYAASFIMRYLVHNVMKMNYLFLNEAKDQEQRQLALTKIKETIGEFSKLSNENKFKFLTVIHPGSGWEVHDGKYITPNYGESIADLKDINVLDLLRYYQTVTKMNAQNFLNYYWKNDLHHNHKGYSEFARAVAWKIEKEKLLPGSH